MREILFKAKAKNWRERPKEWWWVEGYYAKMGKDDLVRNYIIQNYALAGLSEDPEMNMCFNDVEIDPGTLCQYTGMKDKNEKRIWENDLIVIGGKICLVKWSEKDTRWCFIRKLTDQEAFFGGPINPNDCKVIGNIFDDLELWGENTYEY